MKPLNALLVSLSLHGLLLAVAIHFDPPRKPEGEDQGICNSPEPTIVSLTLAQPPESTPAEPEPEPTPEPSPQPALEPASPPPLPVDTQATMPPSDSSITSAQPTPLPSTQPSPAATIPSNRTTPSHLHSGHPSAPVPFTPPRYLQNPAPEYPWQARRRHQTGTVLLCATVNESGHPTAIKLLKSSGSPILDQAALRTVRTWLFQPARRGNASVVASVQVPVSFYLSAE